MTIVYDQVVLQLQIFLDNSADGSNFTLFIPMQNVLERSNVFYIDWFDQLVSVQNVLEASRSNQLPWLMSVLAQPVQYDGNRLQPQGMMLSGQVRKMCCMWDILEGGRRRWVDASGMYQKCNLKNFRVQYLSGQDDVSHLQLQCMTSSG